MPTLNKIESRNEKNITDDEGTNLFRDDLKLKAGTTHLSRNLFVKRVAPIY